MKGKIMFKIGTTQKLYVNRFSDYGAFLSEEPNGENEILLPNKFLKKGLEINEAIDVFVYRDSEQRLTATTQIPLLQVGDIGFLKVVSDIKGGYFLDMGLDKDLYMPYNEAKGQLKKGKKCLVKVYVDETDKLCATMKIYNHLNDGDAFSVGESVMGTVIEIKPSFGAFVAIDNQYHALIPEHELYHEIKEGAQIKARITKIRPDGKVYLSVREKSNLQIHNDVETILKALEESDGVLYINDETSPEIIRKRLNMSKKAFKRAAGKLLKEGVIILTEEGIEKTDK